MFFVKIFSSKGLVSKVLRKVLQLHSKTTSNKHVDKAAVTSESKQVPRKDGNLTSHLRDGGTAVTHAPTMERLFAIFSEQQPWA